MSEWQGIVLAFVFGLAFNAWVARQRDSTFVALWVAFGVTVILLIAALVDDRSATRLVLVWRGQEIVLTNHAHASLWVLRFFVAGGLPMIIGSLWRHLDRIGRFD